MAMCGDMEKMACKHFALNIYYCNKLMDVTRFVSLKHSLNNNIMLLDSGLNDVW